MGNAECRGEANGDVGEGEEVAEGTHIIDLRLADMGLQVLVTSATTNMRAVPDRERHPSRWYRSSGSRSYSPVLQLKHDSTTFFNPLTAEHESGMLSHKTDVI